MMSTMRQGFSLVELSIVLVILGLLTGGILAGQSLIRAAELRSVSNEFQRYVAATNSFRDKYFALPGDMNNAQAVWGAANTNNGNNDGVINTGAAASVTGEQFEFWNQLARAGLIEGTYSGLAGATNAFDGVIGTNVPKSKMGNAGWGVQNISMTGNANFFTNDYGNAFTFGSQSSGGVPQGANLKPEEAWNIDTKMDDGLPGSGKIWGIYWNNACATAASATDYASRYNLASSAKSCALIFSKPF